jgi:putative transposase
MQEFRSMTNLCIDIGLRNNASTLKRLSTLSYHELQNFTVPSYYKLCAISKAAGILATRKKSMRRDRPTKDPHVKAIGLTSCYGFRITDGKLRVPVGNRRFETIPLNEHSIETISAPSVTVNSFTSTERFVSISISKEIQELSFTDTVGVDRNLRNLTVGNENEVTYYDLTKAHDIADVTRQIIGSIGRNDVKLRHRISGKYGGRRKRRIAQLLHHVSKDVVENAKRKHTAIVFEDIREIRSMYRRGNWRGRRYRSRMNGWSFAEIKRQIEYKAAWDGVPVIALTRAATRGTSVTCFQCGERLQESRQLKRKVWCSKCRTMFDRDEVAAVNIARRGRVRFARSKGEAVEAMVQEPNAGTSIPKVILKVDTSKLTVRHEPTT